MDIKTIQKDIEDKIGAENFSLISDIITENVNEYDTLNSEKENLETEKTELKNKYDSLLETNGKLLQKIPMGIDNKKQNNPQNSEKDNDFSYSFSSCFDKKTGKFKE